MRAARLLFASFLGYACVEGIVFHSGLYAYYLRPDTFAGILETFLYNERVRPLDGLTGVSHPSNFPAKFRGD